MKNKWIKGNWEMIINAHSIRQILIKNFGFTLVDTEFGQAIRMDCHDAFIFATVTGARYLDNDFFPFTPKGLMKTYRDITCNDLVTGIFDNGEIVNSPYELSKRKPYLFDGDKYLLIVDCNSEKEYISFIQNCFRRHDNMPLELTKYMVLRTEAWKKGNGMECFLEYLACEIFKRRGYIVENQIPLEATVGSPDFGGYKLVSVKGFYLIELAMIRLTRNYALIQKPVINNAIVGEAKTSTKVMAEQLRKYIQTGWFLKAYELHPDKEKPSERDFGLLNIDSEFNVSLHESSEDIIDGYNPDYYLSQFGNFVKANLLANYRNDELLDMLRNDKVQISQNNTIGKVICEYSIEEIIERLKGVLI